MTASSHSGWTYTAELVGPVFNKKKTTSFRQALHAQISDRRTRLLTAFVPDELIYSMEPAKKSSRTSTGVLLLVDVFDYILLCDKFRNAENRGSFGLMKLLNCYLSVVIEEIYSSGGDILRLSITEGLLALWKVQKPEEMSMRILRVAECALRSQESLEYCEDELNVGLKGRITISAGTITSSIIGVPSAKCMVFTGSPIIEAKMARKSCLPGEVIITGTAWEYCDSTDYKFDISSDRNVKIHRVLHNNYNHHDFGKERELWVASMDEGTSSRKSEKPRYRPSVLVEQSILSSRNFETREHLMSLEEDPIERKVFAGRTSISEAVKRKIGVHLKEFVMSPVLEQIEKDRPLEYLTENRRVTSLWIEMLPIRCNTLELLTLTDKCYVLIYRIVSKANGRIYSVNVYDKDVLFKIIFGLRGHSDNTNEDSKNALLCGSSISETLCALAGVQGVAVGISTGMVCCGVFGHSVRRQYAVVGRSVKIAMKMMFVSYQKISCDYDTLFLSNLPLERFLPLGMRKLSAYGERYLYQFISDSLAAEASRSEDTLIYPILGRQEELDLFSDLLDDIGVHSRAYAGLLIEAPSRIGKSRLLDAYAALAQSREIRPIKMYLYSDQAEKSHTLIHHILEQILGMEDCQNVEDRQRVLLEKLSDVIDSQDFCYFNVIMRVKFPLSSVYCEDSAWHRHLRTLNLVDDIFRLMNQRTCILVDNAQFLDDVSWRYVSRVITNHANVVLVLSTLDSSRSEILSHKSILHHRLEALKPDRIAPLVCQFLNVQAIPRDLERSLKIVNTGVVPGWCEAHVVLMRQRNAIKNIRVTLEEASSYDLVFPEISSVIRIPPGLAPDEVVHPSFRKRKHRIWVCVKKEAFQEPSETTFRVEDIWLETILNLTPYEQDLLKYASVLAPIVVKSVLQAIMPNYSALYTARAVAELMHLRVLRCASVHQKRNFGEENVGFCGMKRRKTFADLQHFPQCRCRLSSSLSTHSGKSLPPYAHCKLLQFQSEGFQNLVYEQITDIQKTEIHSKAVLVYEKSAQKCNPCGGGPFLTFLVKDRASDYILLRDDGASIPPRFSTLKKSRSSKIRPDGDLMKPRNQPRSVLSITESNSESLVRKREVDVNRKMSMTPREAVSASMVELPSVASSYAGDFDSIKDSDKSPLQNASDPSHLNTLTKFRHIDYRNCQCSVIVQCVFWELFHHTTSVGLEKSEKSLTFLLEYGAALIEVGQPVQALKFLNIAHELNEVSYFRSTWNGSTVAESISRKRLILSLIGDAQVALGNYLEAKRCYTQAVSLNMRLSHQSSATICLRMTLEVSRQRLYQTCPERFLDKAPEQSRILDAAKASSLRRLSTIFSLTNKTRLAKLASVWSLNLVLTSSSDFIEKCETYKSAQRVYDRLGGLTFLRRLSTIMLLSIDRKERWLRVEEVAAAAEVLQSIFEIRALCGRFEEAIAVGTRALRIASMLRMSFLRLNLLPLMIQVLIRTKRIYEAADLMQQLYYLSDEDIDRSGITWYYALCLDFLLDAGIILETVQTCLEFSSTGFAQKPKTCVYRDPNSWRRLLTNLWTWQLRTGVLITPAFVQPTQVYIRGLGRHNFSQIVSSCKVLECYSLIFMRCTEMKKFNEMEENWKHVEALLAALDRVVSHVTFIKPRFYVLKAYINVLRGRRVRAKKYLSTAKKVAIKHNNKMAFAWLQRNERDWKLGRNMSADCWLDDVGNEDPMEWQNVEGLNVQEWSSMFFALPVSRRYL